MKTIAESLESGDPAAVTAALLARSSVSGIPEMLREVALSACSILDAERPPVPAHLHPYLALGAAAGLTPLMRRDQLLPLAQSAWYLARSPRRTAPAPPGRILGEEVHLSKSLLTAIQESRAGDAERLLHGLLRNRERVQVGDLFFQGAAEDNAVGGHKLVAATLGWILARQIGWRNSPMLVLRPAIRAVASPPRDTDSWVAVSRSLGSAMLDLDRVSRQSGALPNELMAVEKTFGGEDRTAAAKAAVAALSSGAGADGLLDVVSRHLSRAILGGGGDAAVHAFTFAHAARFVLHFSKSSHRVLPALQAAVLAAAVKSAPPILPAPATIGDRGAALNEMTLAIDMGDTAEVLGLLQGYLASGGNPEDLVATLAREAAKEDAHATGGHSLIYAHAALQEYRHSTATDRSLHLVGLASWLSSLDHSREVVEALGSFA